MDDLHQDMERIRETAESQAMRKQAMDHMNQQTTTELEDDLKPVLDAIAQEFADGDKNLILQPASDGGVGFVIQSTATDTIQFAVSATCKEKDVTLNVTDGKWEEVHGTIGNWAEWTDQKQVYSGPLDEERIRRCLEKQFLPWYKHFVNTPQQ